VFSGGSMCAKILSIPRFVNGRGAYVCLAAFAFSLVFHAGSLGSFLPGKMPEAELLQDSDGALGNAALSLVKHGTYAPGARAGVPIQREAFINVQFNPAK
jgi:hypothetical protein